MNKTDRYRAVITRIVQLCRGKVANNILVSVAVNSANRLDDGLTAHRCIENGRKYIESIS